MYKKTARNPAEMSTYKAQFLVFFGQNNALSTSL